VTKSPGWKVSFYFIPYIDALKMLFRGKFKGYFYYKIELERYEKAFDFVSFTNILL